MHPLRRLFCGLALLALAPACLPAASVPMSITKSAAPTAGLLVGDTVNICLAVTSPRPQADILWVIDVSQSMNVGISNTVANIITFTAQLATQNLDYRNRLFIYTGDSQYWYFNDYNWATDDADFTGDLNDSLGYIYSGIEWTLEAVQYANSIAAWRAGASKTIILITDEGIPCAERNYSYPFDYDGDGIPDPATETIAGTTAILNAGGVTLHSISKPWPWDTDPEHRCDPQDLPPPTGGLWLDYSSPPSQWDNLLLQLAAQISGNSNIVVSDPVPPQLAPIPGALNGGTLSGNSVSWSVSSAAQGTSLQFCFDATVVSPWPGLITNTAQVAADNLPTQPSNGVPFQYATPTITPTSTITQTSTSTRTDTETSTHTRTATPSATPTYTRTPTPSSTPTPSFSSTATPSATPTETFSSSPTPSATPTRTPTHTPSGTRTASPTQSFTHTETPSATPSGTRTATPTQSFTYTETPSVTPSATRSATRTASPSPTATPSFSSTATITATSSATPTATESWTASPSATITPTFSITQTHSPSPTITPTYVPQLFHLMLGVYNSAGERVRQLYDGGSGGDPALAVIAPAVLGDWASSIAILFPLALEDGRVALNWDGANDQGQGVSNGTYWLKFEVRDSNDRVTAFTRGLALLRPDASAGVDVFNGAGEKVARLPLPADAEIGTLALEEGAGAGAVLNVHRPSGWTAVAWDGLNSRGEAVQAGSYSLRAHAGGAGKDLGFVLLRAPGTAWLQLAPNPLGGGQTRLRLDYAAPLGALRAEARLYDVAGQLVRQSSDNAGGTLWLDTDGLAGGIYLAVVAVEGSQPWRQARKLGIVR
jgi:hypothetical protein